MTPRQATATRPIEIGDRAPARLTMTRPDDWHVHLRDGAVLPDVLAETARRFGRAIVMPNLDPPVTTTAAAGGYRQRILAALAPGVDFTPLMTLYLTETTTVDEVARAQASGVVYGIKYYPAGATTNSLHGVRDISRCYPVLAAMERHDLPLLIHGEDIDPEVDVFDREAVFIDRTLGPLLASFPGLRVVLEHVTTTVAVDFVRAQPVGVGATITAHHLMLNRNALFDGGIHPHYYCRPLLQREADRRALIAAAISGDRRFFLGSDSAPHARRTKEAACGCAGIYTAHAGIEFYAEVFEEAGALTQLEGFASFFGADFYRLPRNTGTITLVKQDWQVPTTVRFGREPGVPLRAGQAVGWMMVP
ncbi:MAG: dihydroorotase [Acidiferrobacter sp.]